MRRIGQFTQSRLSSVTPVDQLHKFEKIVGAGIGGQRYAISDFADDSPDINDLINVPFLGKQSHAITTVSKALIMRSIMSSRMIMISEHRWAISNDDVRRVCHYI